jgi:hypothetical protein
MATQTTKNQKAAEFLISKKEYLTSVKPLPSSRSDAKPFVMPDLFLEQAEDMGKFLDKNPLSKRD